MVPDITVTVCTWRRRWTGRGTGTGSRDRKQGRYVRVDFVLDLDSLAYAVSVARALAETTVQADMRHGRTKRKQGDERRKKAGRGSPLRVVMYLSDSDRTNGTVHSNLQVCRDICMYVGEGEALIAKIQYAMLLKVVCPQTCTTETW